MTRRLILAALTACVLFLLSVAQASAYTTTLTLVGKRTITLERSQVRARVSWDGTQEGNINPTLRYVYQGQTLYKLVGKVDDADSARFNRAKAEAGYRIRFVCRDGYRVSISSRRIIGKKHWIVAKKKDGAVAGRGGSLPLRRLLRRALRLSSLGPSGGEDPPHLLTAGKAWSVVRRGGMQTLPKGPAASRRQGRGGDVVAPRRKVGR